MKLQYVDITFVYEHESGRDITIAASIGQHGWQQWGATRDILAANVEVISALTNVLGDYIDRDIEP